MNAMADPPTDTLLGPPAAADSRPDARAKELGVTVVDLLREGPMTRTWRARTQDGRDVALIVLAEASPEDRERFRRTAEDLKATGDAFRQVLRVYDVSPSGEAIVTDVWTHGTARDLGALQWPSEKRLAFGRRMIDALASLHRAGFVHGALSPDSVLLDNAMGPVLGELGTVSRREPFAAPEVCRGEVPTVRSDVYSAGRVLLELLKGVGNPALEEVLGKSVSPLTLVRYANATELGKAIDNAIEGIAQAPRGAGAPPSTGRLDLIPARPSTAPGARTLSVRPAPPRRVTRTQLLGALLGVLVVVAILMVIFAGPHPDGPEPLHFTPPAAPSR